MTTLATSKLRLEYQAHTNAVTDIKIEGEDNDQIIYTASRDKSIKGWKLEKDTTGEELSKLKKLHLGHGGFVNAFDLIRPTGTLISVGRDEMLRVWPFSNDEEEKKYPHKSIPMCILTHSLTHMEGEEEKSLDYILTGGKDGVLNIWNSNFEIKKRLTRKDNVSSGITSIKSVPKKSELVLCAYEDGAVVEWNIDSEMVENVMRGHETIINAITVSPDGSLCATAGRDKVVLLWDLKGQNNKCEISIDEPVHCLEFAFSAYWLAAGTDNGISIWDIIEKDIVIEIPNPENTTGVCTSICWADRFTLIAGYSDGLVRKYVFNVE
ncbi:guanine nucleotide-binding protein subunit beta-2-like 1 protein [Nematocida sp. LUAm3]|nr:guanine nucleotide-binding protein subunit beta-2-like 1 protein [Nematocida sp. LUAm3]KAI5174749.1 guanine nucleotide-binding protein subunit beta-2-like 1 protein [Nematocida sp. LUAm2]KAI5177840.1 guanine nucleotide-binding protein subunit beta-2-like 1 protein [Nematocida sp. LUAm1]